jgi:hypothetical protein
MAPTTLCSSALHLIYTSYTPVPGLLQTIRQTIADACQDA